MLRLAALPLLAAALSACAAPPPPATVFKSIGSRQCEGGGQPLPALARQLSDGGVAVVASRCGRDGRMYPMACGAADGRIGIFEIAAGDTAAAAKLGFQPLSTLPGAREAPCP